MEIGPSAVENRAGRPVMCSAIESHDSAPHEFVMRTRRRCGPRASGRATKSYTPSTRTWTESSRLSPSYRTTGASASPFTPTYTRSVASTLPSSGAKIRTDGPVARSAARPAERRGAGRAPGTVTRTATRCQSAGSAAARFGHPAGGAPRITSIIWPAGALSLTGTRRSATGVHSDEDADARCCTAARNACRLRPTRSVAFTESPRADDQATMR